MNYIYYLDVTVKYGPLLGIIIGGIWTWYKFCSQEKENKKIRDRQETFQKEMQDNKANNDKQLNELTEKLKYENQRRLTDFSLYAQKKHERYIPLGAMLNKLNGCTIQLTQSEISAPSFSKYNRHDIENFLNLYNLTEKYKEELLSTWMSDNEKGKKDIYAMMLKYQDFDLEHTLLRTVDEYYCTKLYLPEDLSLKIREYLLKCQNIMYMHNNKTISDNKKLNDQLNKDLWDIFNDMQKHLMG